MATTYTVKSGDTLWEIVQKYRSILGSNIPAAIDKVARLNNISNPNLIQVGQVLKIDGTVTEKKTASNKATVDVFGLVDDTKRQMFASWSWSKSDVENYEIHWWYQVELESGKKVGILGSDTTTTVKHATYTAPDNAIKVTFQVKPVAKKKTVNGKETTPWTAEWSTDKSHTFVDPPTTPTGLTVELDELKLTASVSGIDKLEVYSQSIQFELWKNDESKVTSTTAVTTSTGTASASWTVEAGAKYKVRCRGVNESKNLYSEWSDWSSTYNTRPATPSGITTIRAESETSVYLEWAASTTAEKYIIEYVTKKEYFDGSNQIQQVSGEIKDNHYLLTGLETGQEYFFRVKAVNKDSEESGWSPIKSIVIGEPPTAPTTWSSTTTAIVGEEVILYWVHNAKDNSSETKAQLELTVDGVTQPVIEIKKSTAEDEKDKTAFYIINTSVYAEGTKLQWRVRTCGITGKYNEKEDDNYGWSVQRTVDIYARPSLDPFCITDKSGNRFSSLGTTEEGLSRYEIESFPFYFYGLPGPQTQIPLGYHLEIISNEAYETVDNIGNPKSISVGESVYSRYFEANHQLVDELGYSAYAMLIEMSASNVNLDNNISYTAIATASMDSGLTASASLVFTVAWTDELYSPNAEISYDSDTVTTHIRPFCHDEDENLIPGLLLSVYRREFDGTFTELATGLDNLSNTYITDPHPALDYARYRIVATTQSTGAVSYYDLPGYPVGEKAVIIQWEEEWSSFDATGPEPQQQPAWSGSMLRLPYNIDVSDNNKPDVSLIEYIGREHPVSYYGTHLGTSATWNVVIEKDDEETLYGLRRLARWMGDVYVREPSGSGYWANITVSFSQKHLDPTIPVTLDITRVEGGV